MFRINIYSNGVRPFLQNVKTGCAVFVIPQFEIDQRLMNLDQFISAIQDEMLEIFLGLFNDVNLRLRSILEE